MTKIDDITARLNAATPGPWHNDTPTTNLKFTVCGPDHEHLAMVNWVPLKGGDEGWSNAELIANAPTDIAYLLAEVKRLSAPVTDEEVETARMELSTALIGGPRNALTAFLKGRMS